MAVKQFGDFTFDEETLELRQAGQSINTEPKILSLLSLFIQNPDKILTREAIYQVVWPDVVVTDNTLNRAIANLRKLLNDSSKSPNFIETVPKRGYRFIAQIEDVFPVKPLKNSAKEPRLSSKSMLLLLILALLIITSVVAFRMHDNGNASSNIETLTRLMGNKKDVLLSPSGNQMMFINTTNKHNEIWLRQLDNDKSYQLSHPFDEVIKLAYLDDDNIIHLVAEESNSTWLYRAQIIDGRLEKLNKETINFIGKAILDIAYHVKSKRYFLIIADHNNIRSTQLYSLNYFDKELVEISIPLKAGSQLTRIDISPNQEHLLLVGQNIDTSTSLYQYTISREAVAEYHQFDNIVRNAIWQNNSKDIYYTGFTQKSPFNCCPGRNQCCKKLP